VKGFYSPVDRLAAELPRTKGTGAEFMTELSKRPGYKPQEAQDRDLQTLMALPKMAREEFLAKLKTKPAQQLEDTTLTSKSGRSKYEEHTLPGGSNYREILMRMPHDEQRAKEFSDPASGHWDTPNVLAHVRAKDRTGPNGEKLLHIEEIQSDWHQKGREHGYATPESLKEFRAVELRHKLLKRQLDEAKAQSESAENSLKRKEPLFQQPDVRERYEAARVKANNDLMDLMPQVMKAQAEMQDFGHKMNSMVPNAPFKKNWHEMALKKMIHHAAENGYHGIVITPGLEQAKRYNLAKHISGLQYDPEQKHLIAAGHNGEAINKIVEPHELPDYLGKEITEKLLNTLPLQGRHHLTGINLQTGGEGMTGFYDKMVPSFLNQFGKKYGAQVALHGHKLITKEKSGQPTYNFRGEPSGEIAYPEESTRLHHFPITPEMREDVIKNGVPLYAKGGAVEDEEPKKTVKAYKLFRVHPKHPGKLFPLFVDANTPVEMGKWIAAKEGEMANGKVKSKIGPLAYRPGWHAGDLPVATHIGEKSDPALTAPDVRPENHAWAEVEMPHDVDWQSVANERGVNKQGRLIPSRAHITDQLPVGGHYRYKTNPNMTGNWLIGGSMKVNRMLSDKDVAKINKAAGAADLPRQKPFNPKKFGFAEGGTVGPEEWMAEEHINHKAKPVGYTKEKVTVSPSLDQMQYELISVKHSKKVK